MSPITSTKRSRLSLFASPRCFALPQEMSLMLTGGAEPCAMYHELCEIVFVEVEAVCRNPGHCGLPHQLQDPAIRSEDPLLAITALCGGPGPPPRPIRVTRRPPPCRGCPLGHA